MIKFTGCKHLCFDKSKYGKSCILNLISSGGTDKCVWVRDSGKGDLVQFCNLRGRLNGPELCLSDGMKMCSNYEEFEHSIPESDLDE